MLGWLGKLLAPAEDPRRGASGFGVGSSGVELLLADLQRSRAELAQLRARIEQHAGDGALASELAREEQMLVDAEQSLLLSQDERRARQALLDARRRAAEVEVWVDA